MNKETIILLLQAARKSQDSTAMQAYSAVLSAIQTEEGRGNKVDVLQIIAKEHKKFIESYEAFSPKSADTAETMLRCSRILSGLLPSKVPEEKYGPIVDEICASFAYKLPEHKGLVIKAIKNKYGATVDMGAMSKVVQSQC